MVTNEIITCDGPSVSILGMDIWRSTVVTSLQRLKLIMSVSDGVRKVSFGHIDVVVDGFLFLLYILINCFSVHV